MEVVEKCYKTEADYSLHKKIEDAFIYKTENRLQLVYDACVNFIENYEKEIYYFDDWVEYMLNVSDYSEFELLAFNEHYQNLLSYEENSNQFEKWNEENNKKNS